MKRIFLFILTVFIFSLNDINAQVGTHISEQCGFIPNLEKLKKLDSKAYPSDAVFEQWMERKMAELKADNSRMPAIVTIPVVVHVIHNGDAVGQDENIPDAQVFSQMKVLNDDFRRKIGTYGYNTHPDGADTEIEFCLASTDPSGNESNGINRVNLGVEAWESQDDINGNLKPATAWDPTKYYNIWVCNLDVSFGGGGILLGYAQFPSMSGLAGMPSNGGSAATDGVVVNHRYFGSNEDNDGTFDISSSSLGRTLTHETGHWLGLRHIWGDGGCGVDDFCEDTPEADEASSGCNPNSSACGSVNMVQNYMDYSSDFCTNIFTNDQKDRMLTVMANSPRRQELFSSDACDGPPFIVISSSESIGCAVLTVQFNDLSSQSPTSWNWQFPGGEPSSSTLQNPIVSYSQLGTFDVTLSATNEYGTVNKTFTDFITVSGTYPETVFEDDFEDGSILDWTIENPTGTRRWANLFIEDETDRTGDFALVFKNYDSDEYGARDAVISPTINLYGRTEASLTFDHAYKRAVQTETDSLIIYLSTDNGATFPHVLFADAENGTNNLATGGLFNGDFTPASEGDWCNDLGTQCFSLDLSAYAGEENVKIKFENFSRNGSNFYIDNVKVNSICVPTDIAPFAEFYADQLGCLPYSVQFSDETIGIPSAWSWSFPGGNPSSSTDPNPMVEYTQEGEYEVSLTVTNNNGTNTSTKTNYIIVSTEEPAADFDLVQSFNNIVLDNQSVNGAEYLWDFGDGNFSTEVSPTHDYAAIEGTYTITLTVTNGCGSKTTSQVVQTTSIKNPFGENTAFNIYPNPNNGQFTIEVEGKNHSSANITAYDILGRVVYQSEYQLDNQKWTKDINLANQAAGTYIIKIDIEGESSFRKIVIRE